MASGSEDEQQGAWYFGSNSYVPESSSESEEEPQKMEEIGPQQQNQHKPKVTNELRQLIFQEMLSLKVSDLLPHGTFKCIAKKYGCTHRTIRDLWKRAIQTKEANKPYIVESKYKNCGRKRVVVPPNLLESRPIGERTCIRDVATCLDLAPTTVWRLIKRGEIKAHSNPLHPALTDALSKKTSFKDTRFTNTKEKVPYKAAKSSKFIPKAMFLGAVARPKWNRFGQCTFDRKIGIFPFINRVVAPRDSKNRPRGSIEIKPTESVNQEVYRRPSIIFIQQDNARVHITNDDPIWQQHNRQGGLTFIFTQQPPNSPDCNILDLGFFRSIESLMHKKMPKNMTELITAVEDAFRELYPKTLSNLRGVMTTYNHTLKRRFKEDNDRLRIQVRIPTQLVREAVAFLNPNRNQQQTQALTENEDVAQTTEIIQEAYDQAVEETQR
ncbi:uncharacterized protein LOC130798203 [Amaranthus tricolor]|uniref:uncharacterized protein LOC130798203 n=1 Tax=Amaranthus tricolor TaxID=29722 RepID=UPI002584A49E|nr:uncharacterized protein LOC130798203 [Amaranthus tricolor]